MQQRARAEDLVYDPDTHTSTCRGIPVPHVTAVLAACGMSTDFTTLPRYVQAQASWKRSLGSVVHMDCHAYDDGDLDWDTVHRESRPYVEAWATCRENLGLHPVVRERQVFHDAYWYTGILDGLYHDRPMLSLSEATELALVDLKVGDPTSAAADLQTAAYAHAWKRAHFVPIVSRMAVWLRPGRRIPYKVFPYDDPIKHGADFQKFLACVTVYNEQVARRGRPRVWQDNEEGETQ